MKPSIRKELTVPPERFKVVCIGDTHFPFTNKKQLDKVYELIRRYKPNFVLQIGDLYDMYSFSRFASSVDLITPKNELEQARKAAEKMWATVRKIVPKAKCFQLRGNHSARIYKLILDKAPQYESIITTPIEALFDFPGVEAMPDHRSELVINDVVFCHGWKSVIGAHARWFGQSTVCGHLHRGGLVYFPMKNKPIFELNCGFIADIESLPLSYGETKTNSWVSGVGVIDQDGPRFVHL